MGYLIGNDDADVIHLLFHHRLGRLSTAVDTVIADAAVSRIHMVIEYQHQEWTVLDMSRNGLWVNDHRISQHERVPLRKGDIISLGETRELQFTVADDSPPEHLLCQRDGPGLPIVKAIPLREAISVFDEQNTPATLSLTDEGWLFESESNTQYLMNFDWLTLSEEVNGKSPTLWQLTLADILEHTAPMPEENAGAAVKLILKKRTETLPTHATLQVNDETIDLEVRNHHDILLLLAERLQADLLEDREREESGWLYMDELTETLGISEKLINIQIHRLRKQLSQALAMHMDTKPLVMRRRGQLRVGFTQITAYKDNEQLLDICL